MDEAQQQEQEEKSSEIIIPQPVSPKLERGEPEHRRKKISWWGWVLICLALFGLGIFLLRKTGDLLVTNITQEVKIERQEVKTIGLGLATPYFELESLEGTKIKISDFLDTPVILTFWTTWNGASTDQIKILNDYLSDNDEKIFKVLAIDSQEDKSIVANFIKRGGYKVRVLLDRNGAISELYKARNLPATYFIDKKGIVRSIFIGLMDKNTIVDKVGATISE